MFDIIRYTQERQEEWDAFVAQSKNATFLFRRAYMDYHADRFHDHSLMFFLKNRLYALLPANDDGKGTLWSHQGLTYGGLIMSEECKAEAVCELMKDLNSYLKIEGFNRVIYKSIPHIYHTQPSEEDIFAISHVCHAHLHSCDIASVVDLSNRLSFSTLRRRGIKKALKEGVTIMEGNDIEAFWLLLTEHLEKKFGARPVHTIEEITLLRGRFPDNIKLYIAEKNGHIVGGTLLYHSGKTIKTQYISANDEGLQCGAIDLLFNEILSTCPNEGIRYFDFGTSIIPAEGCLNAPLIHQKEGFGARAVCYNTYIWTIE